jgi:hypothetical protein
MVIVRVRLGVIIKVWVRVNPTRFLPSVASDDQSISDSPTRSPHSHKNNVDITHCSYSEKQWTTNCNAIHSQLHQPDVEFSAPLYFGANAVYLVQSIPILAFGLEQNTSEMQFRLPASAFGQANFTYHQHGDRV